MKRLSQFVLITGCFALLVTAEDFWLKKPYTDWADKEATKLLENSPWAHQVSVSLAGPAQQMENGGGGGRGKSRGGGVPDMSASNGEEPSMGGPRSRGGGHGGGDMEAGSGGGTSVLLTVRWQSALPVREAVVVTKLGHEKADSEDARKFLGQTVAGYVVAVIGVPPAMGRIPAERLNELAKTTTALRLKDKDPIPADRAEAVARERSVDLFFVFPKSSPITLEDKEVEFIARLGRIEVKRKFKLKDMVLGDKLEL